MPTIKVSCETDGDIELTSNDLTVVIASYSQEGAPSHETSSYRFRCPICSMVEIKPTEPRVVDLLAASGVEVRVLDMGQDPSQEIISGLMGRVTEDEIYDLTIDLNDKDAPQAFFD